MLWKCMIVCFGISVSGAQVAINHIVKLVKINEKWKLQQATKILLYLIIYLVIQTMVF